MKERAATAAAMEPVPPRTVEPGPPAQVVLRGGPLFFLTLWLARNEGMKKNMKTITTGSKVKVHSFIPT